MARDLTAGMTSAIVAPVVAPVFLFFADFPSGAVRAWTGFGNLTFDGDTYIGVGDFGGVERVDESTDLRANGCRFTLSGIPSSLLSAALADDYQGRTCSLFLGVLDLSSGALIADPYQVFSGRMDVMTIEDGADTASIGLDAENRLIDLYRPRETRYTNEEQQTLFAGDVGLEYVTGLQEKPINWGTASTVSAASTDVPDRLSDYAD
jgi:hypothetical protein